MRGSPAGPTGDHGVTRYQDYGCRCSVCRAAVAEAARWYRAGIRQRPVSLQERFWSQVDKSGDCWQWTGSIRGGYAVVHHGGRSITSAHRLAYQWLVGPIPEGLQLDHLCRNRGCVNPAHLEAVTRRTNILRGVGVTARYAARTECSNGHPLSGDNLIMRKGCRYCRTCERARSRAAYLRHKAVA